MLKKIISVLALAAIIVTAAAQPGGRRPMGAVNAASPIVNPDNTVTFNLNAPNAKSVKISAQFAPKTDMQKNEHGIWTITLGPVEPDIYPYCFEVDGISVMDPQNPDWFPNEGFKNSMVDVRAGKDHDVKSVPHGKVDYVNYW